MITGVVDDRLNISAALRFNPDRLCGICSKRYKAHILHGIPRFVRNSVAVQYMLTVTVITGVTNAFNLIDGIDGPQEVFL